MVLLVVPISRAVAKLRTLTAMIGGMIVATCGILVSGLTTSGWMLTPQFGGTTANVEFEVLTGNSVRFLPNNSIAYINYLNRNVDSLASIFARQGYETTAINPFFNWFFNSRNAYRNMGFSRFVSSEFFVPRFHGPNYEDQQVMDKIMEAADGSPVRAHHREGSTP